MPANMGCHHKEIRGPCRGGARDSFYDRWQQLGTAVPVILFEDQFGALRGLQHGLRLCFPPHTIMMDCVLRSLRCPYSWQAARREDSGATRIYTLKVARNYSPFTLPKSNCNVYVRYPGAALAQSTGWLLSPFLSEDITNIQAFGVPQRSIVASHCVIAPQTRFRRRSRGLDDPCMVITSPGQR